MKKILLGISLIFSVAAANAQIIKSGNITASETWTSNNIYILDGWVYVKAGATLTIQPGTIIKGDFATKGTLIVERDAKIYAVGTEEMPIVFTSQKSVGQRSYGDWGGLIICGRASVNAPANAGNGTAQGEAIIEGGVGSIYGGAGTPNDNDSSGVLKYVRIEYPGVAFQPNSEINGLTLGGVGRKTVIENIQVSYCGDDSYEMFGGTVNLKNIIAYRGWDDDFDTDFGYTGNVQFALSVRDPNIADASGSNGFESDNDGTGTANIPITNPRFSNVTVIGPYAFSSTINSLYSRALHLRRNTRTSVFNSVFVGYNKGLFIESTTTQTNATNGDLRFKNNVLIQMNDTLLAVSGGANINGAFNITTFFNANSNGTLNNVTDAVFTNNSLTEPDYSLSSFSPLNSGAAFTDPYINTSWFTPVTYRGAFGATDWTDCWAEYDPQNQAYNAAMNNEVIATVSASGATTFCAGESVDLTANASSNVTNPTYMWSNGETTQTITVSAAGNYSVTIYSDKDCMGASSTTTVTVNPLPTVNITASGATSFCTGGNVDLTADQTSNLVWSTTASTQTINITNSGTYSVSYTDGNGCEATSNSISVSVSATPVPTIGASGSTTICSGDVVTLTASTSDSYVWNLNGSPISGATSQTYNASAQGLYTVTTTNADPCDGVGTSAQTVVFVNATPTASATSSINDNTVTFTNNSTGATSYDWDFGDGNNSTLANPVYTYAGGGSFTVTLTATNGNCSDVTTISLTSVSVGDELALIENISIYPNPTNSNATLSVVLSEAKAFDVMLIDITGKLIFNENVSNTNIGENRVNIPVNEVENGIYFVRIVFENNQSEMIKLMVNK
jgi:PKD repeat protein